MGRCAPCSIQRAPHLEGQAGASAAPFGPSVAGAASSHLSWVAARAASGAAASNSVTRELSFAMSSVRSRDQRTSQRRSGKVCSRARKTVRQSCQTSEKRGRRLRGEPRPEERLAQLGRSAAPRSSGVACATRWRRSRWPAPTWRHQHVLVSCPTLHHASSSTTCIELSPRVTALQSGVRVTTRGRETPASAVSAACSCARARERPTHACGP